MSKVKSSGKTVKQLQKRPASITASIKNPDKTTITSSLTINGTECEDTEPKLPVSPRARESIKVVVPYEWRLETLYAIGTEYEFTYDSGMLRGGYAAQLSIDTC